MWSGRRVKQTGRNNIKNTRCEDLLSPQHLPWCISHPEVYILGHIISDDTGIKANNILPNPPLNIGIIIEGIINIPWKVILGLYWRDEHGIHPGKANSNRNIIDIPKPIDLPINPDRIYTAPI